MRRNKIAVLGLLLAVVGMGALVGLGAAQPSPVVIPVSIRTMVQCLELGMSPRTTAELVPCSHETVRNWLVEYDANGEKRDWVDNVEAAIE